MRNRCLHTSVARHAGRKSYASCRILRIATIRRPTVLLTPRASPLVKIAMNDKPAGELQPPVVDVEPEPVGICTILPLQHHNTGGFLGRERAYELDWFYLAGCIREHRSPPPIARRKASLLVTAKSQCGECFGLYAMACAIAQRKRPDFEASLVLFNGGSKLLTVRCGAP